MKLSPIGELRLLVDGLSLVEASRAQVLLTQLQNMLPQSDHHRVIVETPYAGNIEQNVEYARACLRDSLLRGEAPFASHLLYTQEGVLCDDVPEERRRGIRAGFAWRSSSERTVVYTDLGISQGMQLGIEHAERMGHPVEFRSLGTEWAADKSHQQCLLQV